MNKMLYKIEKHINMPKAQKKPPNVHKYGKQNFTYLNMVPWNRFIYHLALNIT